MVAVIIEREKGIDPQNLATSTHSHTCIDVCIYIACTHTLLYQHRERCREDGEAVRERET